MRLRSTAQKGFSLVELIVAMGIFASVIAGVTFLAITSPTSPFVGTGDKREQERLAQEALEALNIIKERSWTEIENYDSGSSVKVLKNATSSWALASGTETRGAFTRDITISTVQRDTSDAIVTSGGVVDPATKKVVITISGTGVANYTVETFLTNWETYRMTQTDWGGTTGTNLWTSGSDDYSTSSNMDLPTTSLRLELKLTD